MHRVLFNSFSRHVFSKLPFVPFVFFALIFEVLFIASKVLFKLIYIESSALHTSKTKTLGLLLISVLINFLRLWICPSCISYQLI